MLLLGGAPEPLCSAMHGIAEIADPASLLPVSKIAKMAHEAGHAALLALRVTDHLVDLRPLLFCLRKIGVAPAGGASADIFSAVHHGASVDP